MRRRAPASPRRRRWALAASLVVTVGAVMIVTAALRGAGIAVSVVGVLATLVLLFLARVWMARRRARRRGNAR